MRVGNGWARRAAHRLAPVLSLLTVLALWSFVEGKTLFLPSIAEVGREGWEMLGQGDTYEQLRASLQRLVAGLAIGTVSSLLVVVAVHQFRHLEGVVRLYISVLFGVPSLLLAFLSLAVIGVTGAGVVAVVAVIVFPFVADPLLQGLSSLDRHHIDMARAFRFSRRDVVRHVLLPHTAPYFFSGLRNAHAIAWKVLIVAELFSVRSGLGFEFKNAFDFFRTEEALVWVLLLLSVIAALEYGVLRPLEKRVFAWRATR